MTGSVLIVENSDLVVDKLTKLVNSIDKMKVIGSAADSYNAVKLIKEKKPDYIILDLSLNLGHGIKVLEEIESFEPKPYIIVLTNLNYQYYKEKCLKLGAKQFFDKAMEFEKVYDILNEC